MGVELQMCLVFGDQASDVAQADFKQPIFLLHHLNVGRTGECHYAWM